MKLLRLFLCVLLGTALLWGGIIWHWERTARAVDATDVTLYLVVAPLMVWAGAALLWRIARRRSPVPTAGAPSATSATSATQAADVMPPALGRGTAHRLLAAGVAAPGADDAQALLARAAELPAVTLDPQFVAADGLGVFTRRSDRADEPPFGPVAGPDPDASPRAARAWRLAMHAVQAPLARIVAWHAGVQPPAPHGPAPETDHPTLVMPRNGAPVAERPVVRVTWAVPAAWADADREALGAAAQAWIEHCRHEMPRLQWQADLATVDGGEQALWQAEQRLALLHREGRREPLLLVAADCGLDAGWIETLDAQQRLFTASRPHGWMPGEAAVALLWHPGSDEAPPDLVEDDRPVFLQSLARQRRGRSAEEPGPVETRALEAAFGEALRTSGWPADQVAGVVSDHDLAAGRSTELFRGLMGCLPGDDTAEQCVGLGSVCGHTGIASALLCVLVAAHLARLRAQPVCALPVAHAHDRLAALLTPTDRPPAAVPASPPAAGSGPAS